MTATNTAPPPNPPPERGRAIDVDWGFYIHWPFCVSKCPYCDFNSHVRASVDQARWRDALVKEIETLAKQIGDARVSTVFFGGGTPSLMPVETVAVCINALKDNFDCAPDLEITLEANPSSTESAAFAGLAKAGVNRVSLGVQSFDAQALSFLGRAHGPEDAIAAIKVAQDNFARMGFDLIYALPDQSPAAWQAQLDKALSFQPSHLSVYQLTIEPNTGFAGQVARGAFAPLADDPAADLYFQTQSVLEAAGLPAYEISNHAAPGQECRHNLIYWRGQPYAAVGPGAHGRLLTAQGWQATLDHAKPERWLCAVEATGLGRAETTPVSSPERLVEALLMGLRLREGMDLQRLEQLTGEAAQDYINAQALSSLIADGFMEKTAACLSVTAKGRPLTNAILGQLLTT